MSLYAKIRERRRNLIESKTFQIITCIEIANHTIGPKAEFSRLLTMNFLHFDLKAGIEGESVISGGIEFQILAPKYNIHR